MKQYGEIDCGAASADLVYSNLRKRIHSIQVVSGGSVTQIGVASMFTLKNIDGKLRLKCLVEIEEGKEEFSLSPCKVAGFNLKIESKTPVAPARSAPIFEAKQSDAADKKAPKGVKNGE